MDDGSSDGEVVRIRKDVTIVGRGSCDIEIPHDPAIDPQHLRIERLKVGDDYQWTLSDLNSQSGFWVRVRRIELRDNDQVLAGKNRFVFRASTDSTESKQDFFDRLDDGSIPGNVPFDPLGLGVHGFATFTSLDGPREPFKPAPQIHLIDSEYWVGRDADCAISLPIDPFLGPRHVRVFKEAGRWFAETQGITNGMWVRRNHIHVSQSCAFQLGEQRFHFACQWNEDED